LKVLFASAEVSPFSKVGGLGDVAGSLPLALAALGHELIVATPLYASIPRSNLQGPLKEGTLSFDGKSLSFSVWKGQLKQRVPVWLVDCPRYFTRPEAYGGADEVERFAFFSLAVLEIPRLLGWQPEVLHANDWHTAFAVAHGAASLRADPFYRQCATVYTIHNLQYQGHFSPEWLARTIGDVKGYRVDAVASPGQWPSMMGLGILHADVITTVSETYAGEVLTPEYGHGLEELLHAQRKKLYGVLNGIDVEELDPVRDPHLVKNYSIKSLDARVENKVALQQTVGLPSGRQIPVIGAVTRLVEQKGVDLLLEALPPILESEQVQFILLGTGDPAYERGAKELAARFLHKMAVVLAFDAALAQLIYGGSDLFVMPSRFEPCGLGQLISFRYGAVPVVRRTGGLADTVEDCPPDLSRGTGFVFQNPDANELQHTLWRALAAYRQPEPWRRLMARGMAQDFSWKVSAQRYQQLYETAVALRNKG
jgi:starch synthase